MKSLDFGRFALSMGVGVAMLAACGGSQPPAGAAGALAQSPAIATRAEHGGSWMRPAVSSGGDLLYAADISGLIYVFTYPQGNPVGVLQEFPLPGTLCSDSQGNVFVPIGDQILEYAHGGSQPIATLQDVANAKAYGCSVDSTTGNLAVANVQVGDYSGDIAIFQKAQGSPTVYSDQNMLRLLFCGYDNKGNLFVDGLGTSHFAELPSGSSTFTDLAVHTNDSFGQIQWDGKYITLATRNAATVYRLRISGSTAKVISKTRLKGLGFRSDSQSWIEGNAIVATPGTKTYNEKVGIWSYPAGGKPTLTHTARAHAHLFGVTVSAGSSH
jgi:hypothetical protein